MPELREHAGNHYAVQYHYAVLDDAWHVELSVAVPAPASWAEIPNALTHLPGPALVTAVVPDEDPTLEPTVHLHDPDQHGIPYEIMLWFMAKVAEEVENTRNLLAPPTCLTRLPGSAAG